MKDEHVEAMIEAVCLLSRGNMSGPRGLEAVTMALCGEGIPGHNNVASSLDRIADALESVADAIRERK
jgi:hypothetical protein